MKRKNDNWFTRHADIDAEMGMYDWRDMHVHLPCDDWRKSQFWAFFKDNFEGLGLRRLTATHFAVNNLHEQNDAHLVTFDGEKERVHVLKGDGDFQSTEVGITLAMCDVAVTNPPFSLFRKFVDLMLELEREFLVVGPGEAAAYPKFFELIRSGQLRLGVTMRQKPTVFDTPEGEKSLNTLWFTNRQHGFEPEPLELTAEFDPHVHRRLDNFEAIEVPRLELIPKDFDEVMAVPVTLLPKWNARQFELIGHSHENGGCAELDGEKLFSRIFIRRKGALE